MVFWLMQGLVRDTSNPPGNAFVLGVFRGKDDLIDATGVDDFCAYELTATDFGLPGRQGIRLPPDVEHRRAPLHHHQRGQGQEGERGERHLCLFMRFDLDDLDDGDCLADPIAWSTR